MTIIDFGSLVIVGAVVSLLTAFLKKQWGTTSYKTLGIVVVLSLIAGGFYQMFNAASWWQGFVQSLVDAGAFYTLIVERFKE